MTVDKLKFAKPELRKRVKAREKRHERKVIQDVRLRVDIRDGYCRMATKGLTGPMLGLCSGTDQWAHFGDHKRSRTRGQEPEIRHSMAGSLKLCDKHHDDYDEGRLKIRALSACECQGQLEYERDGYVTQETA